MDTKLITEVVKTTNYKKENHTYYMCKLECGHICFLRIDVIKKEKVFCECCNTLDMRKAAKAQDAQYIHVENLKKSVLKLFKLPCGHVLFKNRAAFLEKEYVCTICRDNEVTKKVSEYNATFVSRSGKYTNLILECGHDATVKTAALGYQKSIPCQKCIDHTVKNRGLVAVDKKKHIYQFLDCGHIQNIGFKEVRLGSFWCRECRLDRFKREAQEAGIEYVGLGSKKANRVYKLPCGCLKELQIGKVRLGTFSCYEHDITPYSSPSKIYLFEVLVDGLSFIKLGVSSNPKNRFRGFGLPDNTVYELLFEVNMSTGIEALNKERSIHNNYKSKRVSTILAKKFFTISGYTECYPIEMKNTLIEELKKLE